MKEIKKLSFVLLSVVLLLADILISQFVYFWQDNKIRYSGYESAVMRAAETSKETIYYTKREVTYNETKNAVPKYEQLANLPNSCGPTAGAIIVGFYDKYFENLIPDYTTYIPTGRYKSKDTVYIPKLMTELYNLMRTNVDDVGVNETDCLNGLKEYVHNKNLNLSYSSVMKSNRISLSELRNSIETNSPVMLFCGKMKIYNLSTSSNYDTVASTDFTGAHVAVGYGLYTVDYYNGNSVFRTDEYVRVSTGLPILTDGYLKISSTDWCNAAYSVLIT